MIWLIALAIPVQGIAAASMVACGPIHSEMALHDSGSELTSHGHAVPEHGMAPAAHAHLHAAVESSGADLPPEGSDISGHDLDGLAKFTCSSCASCCASTALPPSLVAFEPSRAPLVFPTSLIAPCDTFLTGGLERPPRSFLA